MLEIGMNGEQLYVDSDAVLMGMAGAMGLPMVAWWHGQRGIQNYEAKVEGGEGGLWYSSSATLAAAGSLVQCPEEQRLEPLYFSLFDYGYPPQGGYSQGTCMYLP